MHYNGDQKIITTATGVDVTGNVVSDGLNVDGNAYVSTNTHLGGTSDATHTLQVTGNTKISDTLEVTSNISTNGNVLPLTEFNDLGSLTARWDAFLGDVEIGDTKNILPEVDQTSDIGSATLRFNMFAWNSNVYNDLTVDGNLSVGADLTVVAGDVTVNGSITVENDSTFNSNVVFTNIQVDGTANIQLLEVESIVANNVALIGNGAIDVATNAITVVDSFAKTDSRGLKYMIQGTNDDGLSAFAIEIMVAHNDASVFFTRYAEVSNNFDAVIVPQINGANVELTVQCASGSVSNVHSFNVVRLEAR
jgi:cytoskeletal protein CcmA (bactofilin family)